MLPAVVVSGASTGIGRATALLLAQRGFLVFPTVRQPEAGEALRRDAGAWADGISPLLLDVTDEAAVLRAADVVAQALRDRGLRGLVNNAGIGVVGPVELVPLGKWREQLDVNVLGAVAMIQAFLPLLRQARGRIVNVSSVSGRVAFPFMGPYAASKFALEALSDSLRLELRPAGVEVILVEPASVATPIWAKGLRQAEALRSAPAGAWYQAGMERLAEVAQREARRGVPPAAVARVIATALTTAHPATRYPVARGARLLGLFARLAPDRLRDALVARALGV